MAGEVTAIDEGRSGPDPDPRTDWWRPRPGPLVPGLVAAALVALAAVVGRRTWFFSDDWNILADYHDGGLLEPFNGHLSLLPAGAYRLIAALFGTGSYLPYRLVGLLGLGVLGFQLVRFAIVRLSWASTGVWFATIAVAAVMWNPTGATNVMFPFLVNFSIPIAAIPAIWWHLDRNRTSSDVAASLWLCAALATSGLGVMTLGAVFVELLLVRPTWRRWAVMAPGPVLWAAWFLANRGESAWSTDLVEVLDYAGRMILGATTSLAAGWGPGGVVLAVVGVGVLGVAALRWHSVDARAVAALAAPFGFALSTAVTRLDIVPSIPPDETRYSWTIAAYLVLVVVIVWRPERLLSERRVVVALGVLASAVVAIGAVQLVRDVERWTDGVATARPGLTAVLAAVEAVGADRSSPDRVLPLSYVPVTTGGYLAAVDHVGSPVTDEQVAVSATHGQFADEILVDELGLSLVAASGVCDPTERIDLDAAGVAVVPAGTRLVLTTAAGAGPDVSLSRFSVDDRAVQLPSQGPSGTDVFELDLPADATSRRLPPYRIGLPPGTQAERCS